MAPFWTYDKITISSVTLAAISSTGFYEVVNPSIANNDFGKNRGCNFLKDQCNGG